LFFSTCRYNIVHVPCGISIQTLPVGLLLDGWRGRMRDLKGSKIYLVNLNRIEMLCSTNQSYHWKLNESEVAIYARLSNQIVRRGMSCNTSASEQYIHFFFIWFHFSFFFISFFFHFIFYFFLYQSYYFWYFFSYNIFNK
jgi:hypothetical protein